MNTSKISKFTDMHKQFITELIGDIYRLLKITGKISQDDNSPAEFFSTSTAEDQDIETIDQDGYALPYHTAPEPLHDLVLFGRIPIDDAVGIWYHLKGLAGEEPNT